MDSAVQEPQRESRTDVRLVPVASDEDRARYEAGFVDAYRAVFAQAPYQEAFDPGEVARHWQWLIARPEQIAFVAVGPQDEVIGFGVGIPLRLQRDVAVELAGLVDVHATFYLAELGVLARWRGRGLGRALVRERLARLDRERYPSVVLRASASRAGNLSLYEAMGFEEMGVHMHVRHLRTDGHVRSDRRIILHNAIERVRVDDAPAIP